MRRALEYVKTFDGVIAQHAQDPRLTEGAQMNESALAAELGLTGWPAVAEESIIARDALLAEHVGARLHVCHVSTAGSVEVVRWAKKRKIAITAEVTPHHLLLTEDLARGFDARYKVNPPLRRREDVEALRAGVADGTIDIVATDHAPHPREAKIANGQVPRSAWSDSSRRSLLFKPRSLTRVSLTGRTCSAFFPKRRRESVPRTATASPLRWGHRQRSRFMTPRRALRFRPPILRAERQQSVLVDDSSGKSGCNIP